MTHDEQARGLLAAILRAYADEHEADAVTVISTALAASHLAGWRAAREAAADVIWREVIDREQAGDLVSWLNALPDPVPAPTDPERAATPPATCKDLLMAGDDEGAQEQLIRLVQEHQRIMREEVIPQAEARARMILDAALPLCGQPDEDGPKAQATPPVLERARRVAAETPPHPASGTNNCERHEFARLAAATHAALVAAQQLAERRLEGSADMQTHRDAWRRYAYRGGERPTDYLNNAPSSSTDQTMVDRATVAEADAARLRHELANLLNVCEKRTVHADGSVGPTSLSRASGIARAALERARAAISAPATEAGEPTRMHTCEAGKTMAATEPCPHCGAGPDGPCGEAGDGH